MCAPFAGKLEALAADPYASSTVLNVDGPYGLPTEARRLLLPAFVAAFRYMKNRISAFTSLPVASLDRASLRVRLTEIGQSEGASSSRNSAA